MATKRILNILLAIFILITFIFIIVITTKKRCNHNRTINKTEEYIDKKNGKVIVNDSIALFTSHNIGIKLFNSIDNINLVITQNRSVYLALKNKVTCIFYDKQTVLEYFKKLNITLGITAYFKILPEKIYTYPKYKIINMHYSLLYSYSGPTPLEWQIHNKENISGVSIHFITKEIDKGPIIVQESINIKNKSKKQIENELDILGEKCLLKAIHLINKHGLNVPIIKSKYPYSYYSVYPN